MMDEAINLEELLESRDRRWTTERYLLGLHTEGYAPTSVDKGLSSAATRLSSADKGHSSTAAELSSAVTKSGFALTETSSVTSPQIVDVEYNSSRCVEIVLTVVMPGRVKRNAWSLTVARAAVEAIVGVTGEKPVMERDLRTGFEGYWIVEGDAMEIKRRMCGIESSHILGRLFDIDVLRPDATPISRQEVGLTPRRCLICGREARHCMRSRAHSQEEIMKKIAEIIEEYKRQRVKSDGLFVE
jgi:holo-ACP synthase CitX